MGGLFLFGRTSAPLTPYLSAADPVPSAGFGQPKLTLWAAQTPTLGSPNSSLARSMLPAAS